MVKSVSYKVPQAQSDPEARWCCQRLQVPYDTKSHLTTHTGQLLLITGVLIGPHHHTTQLLLSSFLQHLPSPPQHISSSQTIKRAASKQPPHVTCTATKQVPFV
jgi:hypothetical protein